MKVLMMGFTPPQEGGSERHIYEISSRIPNSRVFTQKGSLCRNKIEVLLPKSNFVRNIIFMIFSFFYSIKLLFVKKHDLIHIHENLLYFLVPILRIRYKVIVTIHGITGFKFFENKLLWVIFRFPLKFANKIISVSIADKKILDNYFSNVTYISNGVDLSLYKNISRKIEPKITFVGRIHEQKGIVYLLEAFYKIKDNFPKIRLEIIGGINEYSNSLKNIFPDKRIVWRGFMLDRKEIFSNLASSQILVFPSVWEALPWPALLEGLASGRPVVAASLEGMREIFSNSKDILLFEPKNSKSLAESIEILLKHSALAEKIGKNGAKTSKKYSWDRIAKDINALYKSIK